MDGSKSLITVFLIAFASLSKVTFMLEQMLITNLQRISLNSKPLPQTRLKTLPNVMTSHCLIPSGGPKTETASRIFLDFNAILKL